MWYSWKQLSSLEVLEQELCPLKVTAVVKDAKWWGRWGGGLWPMAGGKTGLNIKASQEGMDDLE